jgi:hypothetical protein
MNPDPTARESLMDPQQVTLKVVMVDDEEALCQGVRRIIERYDVHVADVLVDAAYEYRYFTTGEDFLGVFPVRRGRVLEEAAATAGPAELEAAVGRLDWPDADGPDDWPWLGAWLRGPRGRASWVSPCPENGGALVAAVRAALPPRFAVPARGGNVGPTREEA